MHGVDLTGKSDDQCLPDSQRAAGWDAVIGGQASGINTVAGGNGINGFTGADNMNVHMNHLFLSDYDGPKKAMRFYLLFQRQSAKMKPS